MPFDFVTLTVPIIIRVGRETDPHGLSGTWAPHI